MTGRRVVTIVAAAVVAAAFALPARAQQLVADLSSHLVAITTGFNGAEILLFGAVEGPGDVVVTVRGPAEDQIVRRKVRVAGVWVNGPEVEFQNVPEYYAVFASRPLEQVITPELADLHQIGAQHVALNTDSKRPAAEIASFRDALLRTKEREGLYPRKVGRLSFLGRRLFRTNLVFPGNVPTGSYTVEVLLIRGGSVESAQTTPLYISQAGISADVYEFAHRQSALYGVIAIFVALATGWLAGAVMRRV
ncbi:MAG TPA: TIGR02186 family protein [Alphaproteobacteria bacterium]|nr:TIGR02186 family protein [Alphaproteobacteria bacterium]